MERMMDKPDSEKVELYGDLELFREALEDEIDAVEKGGASNILLSNGEFLNPVGDLYRYRFQVDYAPSLIPDTPCQLKVGKQYYDVAVISAEESALILSSDKELPISDLGRVQLQAGSSLLLKKLIERIENNREIKNVLGDKVFKAGLPGNHYKKIERFHAVIDEGANEEQQCAVSKALENDITFIWGPPGTGKTTVIKDIISNLLRKGKTALIASHTNTAVDGALKRIDKEIKRNGWYSEDDWPILRLGQPSEDLEKRLLEETHIKNKGKDLHEKENSLKSQLEEIINDLSNLTVLEKKINWRDSVDLNDLMKVSNYLLHIQETIDAQNRELKRWEEVRKGFDLETIDQMEMIIYARTSYEDSIANSHQLIHTIKSQIKQNNTDVIRVRDEMKRLREYNRLKEQHESMISLEARESERTNKVEELQQCEARLSTCSLEIETARKEIEITEGKGRLSRLFSGSKLQTLKSHLSNLEKEQKELTDTIPALQGIIKEIAEEIQMHKAILMKMKDYFTSSTKESLQAKEKLLIQKNADLEQKISKTQEQLDQDQERLDELKRAVQGKPEKTISEYQHTLATIRELEDKIGGNKKRQYRLKKALMDECEKCGSLNNSPHPQSRPDEMFSFIQRTYHSVTKEIAGYTVERIAEEGEELKSERHRVEAELEHVREELEKLKSIIIQGARVIGTTLTRTYLNDDIQGRRFDAVIIDEVSMAMLPALWSAICIADSRVVLVGDFMQLPPVVIANTERAKQWLGTDIFEKSGIVECLKKKNPPECFVTLTKQYRMDPEIAECFPNRYYRDYNNTSLESSITEETRKRKSKFDEWFNDGTFPWSGDGHAIHLINTKSLKAWATGINKSRCNYFNASLDLELAFTILEKKIKPRERISQKDPLKRESLIMIVSPYRPQVSLLNKMIASEFVARGYEKDMHHLIKAGTIHSFQGQESEIVIFDLVIDEPHWKGVNLFNSDRDENNKKMFNVAASRSKHALFVIGDIDYCVSRGKNAELAALLTALRIEGIPEYDAKKLFPELTYARRRILPYPDGYLKNGLCVSGEEFVRQFCHDIQSFKTEMYIFSAFVSYNQLSKLLPYLADAMSSGEKKITVFTKARSEWPRTKITEYERCVKALESHGIVVRYRGNMHEKVILIDETIVWSGSLNSLSFSGATGELMERRESSDVYDKYAEGLGLKNLNESLECTEKNPEGKILCPVCGSEMIAKTGSKGEIYWACENDGLTWNPKDSFPYDGRLRCDKCGAPLEFHMVNEPRWRCPEHIRKSRRIRWNELGLPKMRGLIPEEELGEVIEKLGKTPMDFENLIQKTERFSSNEEQIEWDFYS